MPPFFNWPHAGTERAQPGATGSDAGPHDQTAKVSVLVLTFNEEVNIERCLRSVAWADDVAVLDSGSTDATLAIAARFSNVRLFERAFTDFADQRNYGLHQIAYPNPWLLVLDADEEVGPDLAAEIARACSRQDGPSVYFVRRNVVLDGRPLRWNTTASFWIERLFHPEQARYVGAVHEKLEFSGGSGRLRGRIHHHQFEKGFEDWLRRRIGYAEMEQAAAGVPPHWRLQGGVLGGTIGRRRWLKWLFLKMPMRWAIYFVFNLFCALAFLDGRRGVRYIGFEAYSQYAANRMRRRLG